MGYQTLTLEYRVAGNLDGETLAEPFAPVSVDDSEQIFKFTPAALGLIDLTGYGFTSQRANRFVHWFHLINFTGAAGDVNASVARFVDPLDQSSGIVDVEELVVQTDPTTSIRYSRKIFCVPQGYLLRLRTTGRAVLTDDTIVRMGVYVPESQEEDVLIRRARCCTENIPDQEFTIGDQPVCPLSGTIEPEVFFGASGPQPAQVSIDTEALITDVITAEDRIGTPVGVTLDSVAGNIYNITINTDDVIAGGEGTVFVAREGCPTGEIPVNFVAPG
jgi:hypothetical protein